VTTAPDGSTPDGATPAGTTAPESAASVLELLSDGELEPVGRLIGSSNSALYCTVTRRCPDPEPDLVAACVYKPVRGERPLMDFPDGTLAGREVAAFVLSQATGWGIVPPTVMREGPFGQGAVQLWIDADETVDRVALVTGPDARLRRFAVFDAVANNADRKVGHLLPMPNGHIYGVDHGICFHEEPKLRTVLWGWRGRALAADELDVLKRLRDGLGDTLADALAELLAPAEVAATAARVDALLRSRRFPYPHPDWPALPWPPY
jgi:hypothetical protein